MMHSVHNHIDMAKVVKKYKIEKENQEYICKFTRN